MNNKKYDKKKLDELIERATMDCYDESEALSGFAVTLEDELETPFTANVLGEDVVISRVLGDHKRIVAVIRKSKKLHKIDVLDLRNVKPARNAVWIEAYRRFSL